MKNFSEEISIDTKTPVEFIDITGLVARASENSGISEGLAAIFTHHTTTAVKINERCSRLQEDMISFLGRVVPDSQYRHDEDTIDDRKNARSHLTSLILGASETIPVADGKLMLGDWQSIFFVELDGPRRRRRVTIKIIGE